MIVGILGRAGSGKDTVADHLSKAHTFQKVALADPLKRIARDVYNFTDDQLWGPSEMRNKPDSRYVRMSIEECKNKFGIFAGPASTGKIAQYHAMGKDEPGLADFLGLTREEYDDYRATGCVHLTPRFVLQTLGTEGGRTCYNNTWIDYAIRVAAKIDTGDYIYDARTGVRFFRQTELAKPKSNVVISDVRFKNEVDAIQAVGGRIVKIARSGTGLGGAAGAHVSETEQDGIDNYDALIENTGTLDELFSFVDVELPRMVALSSMELSGGHLGWMLEQRAKDVAAGKIIEYDGPQADVPPFKRRLR
jgi:hypothetical protein